MTFRDKLLSADIAMSMHARTYGKAELIIRYYGQKDVVRKIIETHAVETDEFYDKGETDD